MVQIGERQLKAAHPHHVIVTLSAALLSLLAGKKGLRPQIFPTLTGVPA